MPRDPTAAEVRAALWWALENDRAAFVEHRTTAHTAPHARQQADRTLVARWRRAVCRSIVPDIGPN